ncbi:MAG: metal ABC transporter ATP-binding protein [Candidatus Binatia bacterium]
MSAEPTTSGATAGNPEAPETALRAARLTLGYGGRTVLEDVNFELRRGDFWFFLGPNGEGKTTMLRAMLRLLAPRSGELWFHPELAARSRIGFVPQRCDLNPALPTTVREFVVLGLVRTGTPREETPQRMRWALERVGLADLAARDYWSLSGGQRQRALVARALVRRPSFLVLDEPTNGLDLPAEEGVLELLEQLNREDDVTVVFVTHDLAIAARHATHVALFHSGSVLPGTRAEVLTAANLERAYGIRIGISADPSGLEHAGAGPARGQP